MTEAKLVSARHLVVVRTAMIVFGLLIAVFGILETLGIGYFAFPIILGGVLLFSFGVAGPGHAGRAWAITGLFVAVNVLRIWLRSH